MGIWIMQPGRWILPFSLSFSAQLNRMPWRCRSLRPCKPHSPSVSLTHIPTKPSTITTLSSTKSTWNIYIRLFHFRDRDSAQPLWCCYPLIRSRPWDSTVVRYHLLLHLLYYYTVSFAVPILMPIIEQILQLLIISLSTTSLLMLDSVHSTIPLETRLTYDNIYRKPISAGLIEVESLHRTCHPDALSWCAL